MPGEVDTIQLEGVFKNGYGIAPKSILRTPELSKHEKLIWLYLSSFSGRGKSCFPSINRMSKELRISKKSSIHALKNLEEIGYIKIQRTNGGPNTYTLLLSKEPPLPLHGISATRANIESAAELPVSIQLPVVQGPPPGSRMDTGVVAGGNPINISNKNTKKNSVCHHGRVGLLSYVPILVYWNNNGNLQAHKETTFMRKFQKRHMNIVDEYGLDTVCRAIDLYASVVSNPDEYFFNYQWQLWDFIARGLEKFIPEADPLNNYRRSRRRIDRESEPELSPEIEALCIDGAVH